MSTIMSIPFTVVTDVRVFRLAWKYNTVLETQLRYFRAPSLRPLRLSYSRHLKAELEISFAPLAPYSS